MGNLANTRTVKFSKTTGSEDAQTEQQQKTPFPSDKSGWNDLFANNHSNIAKLGESIAPEDNGKRYEIATALAEQDLANNVSGKRKTDRNLRQLTDSYFKELGGDPTRFNTDRYRGTDNALFQAFDTAKGVTDEIFGGIGDAMDFAADNTIGNIVGLFDKQAGQDFKDAFTGDDLAWIPSAAVDLATWALPGSAAWKLPTLLAKGLIENSGSFNQMASGIDQRTGESLDAGQRFLNALAGTAGTALTALPGAGLVKGARAAKGVKQAEKELAEKLIDDPVKAGAKIPAPGTTADEIAALQRAAKDVGTKEAGKLPEGGLVQNVKEIPSATKQYFKTGIDNVRESVKGTRQAAKQAKTDVANAKQAKKDLSKLIDTAKKDKQATLEYQGRNLSVAEAENELKAAQQIIKDNGIVNKATEAQGKRLDDFKPSDLLKGQALVYGNDMLQNSASLGSDSENLFADYANLMNTPDGLSAAAFGHMLGLVPGFRNRQLRARHISPMSSYLFRADAAGRGIRDANTGAGLVPTDYDLAMLAELLRSGNVDTAQTNADNYFKALAAQQGSQEGEGA